MSFVPFDSAKVRQFSLPGNFFAEFSL